MENKLDLLKLLEYVDPSYLDYQEWVNVGMALKHEGYTASDWDSWSARDGNRHRPVECFTKWSTFEGLGNIVTGATITQMAKEGGWKPRSKDDRELDWNDEITSNSDYVVIDKNWIEGMEIQEPTIWNPVRSEEHTS